MQMNGKLYQMRLLMKLYTSLIRLTVMNNIKESEATSKFFKLLNQPIKELVLGLKQKFSYERMQMSLHLIILNLGQM